MKFRSNDFRSNVCLLTLFMSLIVSIDAFIKVPFGGNSEKEMEQIVVFMKRIQLTQMEMLQTQTEMPQTQMEMKKDIDGVKKEIKNDIDGVKKEVLFKLDTMIEAQKIVTMAQD